MTITVAELREQLKGKHPDAKVVFHRKGDGKLQTTIGICIWILACLAFTMAVISHLQIKDLKQEVQAIQENERHFCAGVFDSCVTEECTSSNSPVCLDICEEVTVFCYESEFELRGSGK